MMQVTQPTFSVRDIKMMQRCIQLARLGLGRTGANPLVGCVVAQSDKVIAEGYHQFFGGPHAEVEALAKLSSHIDLSNATLYVNLEPCCHYGKTPPCTNAILKSGICKVVIGCSDPNPMVAGRGAAQLREAGVEVVIGVLEDLAVRLNHRFFVNQKAGRPHIILKWAQSNDGFMDRLRLSGEKGQFAISCPAAANYVHQWRSDIGAVMVGRITAENDNPQLSVRHVEGTQPARIVWDSELRLDTTLQLFSSSGKLIILNYLKDGSQGNIRWLKVDRGINDLANVLRSLYESGVHSILVEGGSTTLQHFIDADIWDEACVFTSPEKLGAGLLAPVMKILPAKSIRVGRDILQYFQPCTPYFPIAQ